MKAKKASRCVHAGHIGRCTERVLENGQYVQCPCNVAHK